MQNTSPNSLDLCQPFQLEENHFRGRLVRLGPAMDAILSRHDYPAPVARLLGETLLLCSALAGALKYEGVFTLQAKGDGAITSLVADVTSAGALRGYATFNRARVETEDPGTDATALLLGQGYLAFTIDQGKDTERYQGIVNLSGRTIADCVSHYFQQSEQIPTGFMVACERQNDTWRGGALMLQRMPRAEDDIFGGTNRGGELFPLIDETANDNTTKDHEADLESRAEALNRKLILLSTTTKDELLDETLPAPDLLHRLFHDEDLVLGNAYGLQDECRCSRARVETVLRQLPPEELAAVAAEEKPGVAKGHMDVTCEFCGRHYDFAPEDLANLGKVFHLDIPAEADQGTGLSSDQPSS